MPFHAWMGFARVPAVRVPAGVAPVPSVRAPGERRLGGADRTAGAFAP